MEIQFISLAVSIIAIVVSVITWRKSRAIYEIKTVDDRNGNEELNTFLKSGIWTVLYVKQDSTNVLRTIYVLGKVKD